VTRATTRNAGTFNRMGMPARWGRARHHLAERGVGRRGGAVEVAMDQPAGQVNAGGPEERVEVARPRDGDGDVAHGVLEDEVPSRSSTRPARRGWRTHRRRRFRPGGNHRGELGVAERAQAADHSQEEERDHHRRSRAVAHHRAVGPHLARDGGADRREDACADHCARWRGRSDPRRRGDVRAEGPSPRARPWRRWVSGERGGEGALRPGEYREPPAPGRPDPKALGPRTSSMAETDVFRRQHGELARLSAQIAGRLSVEAVLADTRGLRILVARFAGAPPHARADGVRGALSFASLARGPLGP
jgi:hypothetical protein